MVQQLKKEHFYVTADTIEQIAYHSDNPAFQSAEFRKALGDYRKYKMHTPNPAGFDLDNEIKTIKTRLRIEQ